MRRYGVMLVGVLAVVMAVAGAGSSAGSSGAAAPVLKMTKLGLGHAWGISDRGQIVGQVFGTTRGPGPYAFRWENGKLTDLGTMGGCCSEAHAINDLGQVVGCSSTSGSSFCRAFLWEDGKMTDLGTLGGGMSVAYGVNDRGQVVGESGLADGFRHAFLWESGRMSDLGTLPGGNISEARGINDRGQVVGSSDGNGMHGFLWQNGKKTDLGGLGVDSYGRVFTVPRAINEHGQVVGYSSRPNASGEGVSHAFLWENGAITDLGTLGGYGSSAEAINDRGQIVGASDTRPDGMGPGHAFVWEKGKMTDLGTLRNDRSDARGINERGEIVGFWGYRNGATINAVLWSGATTPASPAPRAPRLTDRRRVTGTPLRALRRDAVATVNTLVAVDRQAIVTLGVRDPRSGGKLSMLTGTRLAATTLTQRVTAMRTMVGSPGTLALKALLPVRLLSPGATYQLVFTATGTSGKSSKLTIRFLG